MLASEDGIQHNYVHLADTRLGDLDTAAGLAAARALSLDGLDDVHAVNDLAKHDVLAVEPAGDNGRDKELRAVRVGAGVCHRKQTRLRVLELEVFIGKLGTVDRLATSTVAGGEVTTLEHKVRDHTVEVRASIAKALLTRAEGTEVGCRLGHHIVKELELDGAEGSAVLGDVEENVRHGACRSCKRTNSRRGKSHCCIRHEEQDKTT